MKVSIITATYNSEKTLAQTLESILIQDYKNIECIIVDALSVDQTKNIVESFKSKLDIKFVSEKDDGLYDAMNKGIALATGDIVGILNSDDFYSTPDSVSSIVKKFKESGAEVGWANLEYVKEDKPLTITRRWKSSDYYDGLFEKGWHPPHPTFFVLKEVYEKYGTFKNGLKIAADYELMLRLLRVKKVKSFFLDKYIVRMRGGGKSDWRNVFKVILGNYESLKSWKINNLKPPFFLFIKKPIKKVLQVFS